MKRFYGFKFWGGPKTTANGLPRSMRIADIAGELRIFNKKEDRDSWVKIPDGYRRIACSPARARRLHGGMDLEEYEQMINYLKWQADQQETKPILTISTELHPGYYSQTIKKGHQK